MHARVTRERGRVNEIAVLVFVFSVPTLIPGMVHASKGMWLRQLWQPRPMHTCMNIVRARSC